VRDLKRPFGPLKDSFRTAHVKSGAEQHKAKVSTTLPMVLSLPFVHSETCHRPSTKKNLPLTWTSHSLISPKQGTELSAADSKGARVKELIARASNGIIGWGRQLTKKPIQSNNSYYGCMTYEKPAKRIMRTGAPR